MNTILLNRTTITLSIVLVITSLRTFSQGDGPRAMILMPKNMYMLTPAYIDLNSDYNFAQDIKIEGADINSTIVPLTFHHYFGIGTRYAQVSLTPIWGAISGEIERENLPPISIPSLSGFADPYVQFRIGLYNAPALKLEEMSTYKQKFQLYGLFGVSIPIGKYDQNRPVNLGTNRWAIRLATPTVLPFAHRLKHPIIWESSPSVMLYSTNDEPFGGSQRTQNALFIWENHLSHNLSKSLWFSLDARYQIGGETTTDGGSDDNKTNQLGIGATGNYQILPPLGFMISYGDVVTEGKGKMLRFRLTLLF